MTKELPHITVPVLVGPTASGKTALAMDMAEAGGWEIVSCDSRQIYRHMDIGTAKPRREEMSRIRHWLVDIRDPSERYSASAFVNDAGTVIRRRASEGKRTLLCGGTGLYFESLKRGIGPQVPTDPLVGNALDSRAEKEGIGVLYRELQEKDPESAAQISAQDSQRIKRAFAVHTQTGKKISVLKRLSVPPEDLDFRTVVLMPPRSLLYDRINHRVDEMVRCGLWEEFRGLRDRGYSEKTPGLRCVGYQELFVVERGECTLADAIEKIKQNTRRYAKRQMTWFRSHDAASILEYDENSDVLRKNVLHILSSSP